MDSGQQSVIAEGARVSGTIVCAGALVIAGQVRGDVHGAEVSIASGGDFEGNIVACSATVGGRFKGVLYANAVELTSSAVVNADLYCGRLSIQEGAEFFGPSYRLGQSVEPPEMLAQIAAESIAPDQHAAPRNRAHLLNAG